MFVLREWRAVVFAIIAATSVFDPQDATWVGGPIAAILLISSISSFRLELHKVLAICLGLWFALSITWAEFPEITRQAVQVEVLCIVLFLSAFSVIRNRIAFNIVGLGYLVGCGISVVLVSQENNSFFREQTFDTRITIANLNINYLAYALALGLVISTIMLTTNRLFLIRAGIVLVFLASVAVILASGTRGAWIATGLLGLWILVFKISPKFFFRVAALLTVIAAVVILTGLADNWMTELDNNAVRSAGDLSGRLIIWPYAREVFQASFVFGIGLGGFFALNSLGLGAHNVILEYGTGTGIVGVALFLSLYIAILRRCKRVSDHSLGLYAAGAFLVVSAPIYLSGYWNNSPAGWIVLALIGSVSVIYSKQNLAQFAPTSPLQSA